MTEHSHHIEDYATSIRPSQASNLLLWAVAGFFALILIWAIFTRLDRSVHGQGRIVPTAQLQTVSNLEGGIVEAILVKPGDKVRAGSALIRLDQTQSGSELGSSQAAFHALEAKVARLTAEVTRAAPAFPADAPEAVMIERALWQSREADYASLSAAGAARGSQAERAIAEAQASLVAKTAAEQTARSEANLLRPLVAKGIEPRMSLVQSENQAAVAAAEVVAARATVARARASLAEANAAMRQQQQDWRAKAAEELATAQAELATRRRQLPALSDKLKRTVVRAPLDGRINRILVSTVGGTVRPGEPIVEIVPSDGALTVEVQVKPEDIAFVAVGQPAKIKVTAYDSSIYGSLDGKVVSISPDAVSNERTGETHYTVRVRTTGPALKGPDGAPLAIGPGMVADVSLIGDKRSVMNYVLTPISRLREGAFRER